MQIKLNASDRQQIEESIHQKYSQAAKNPAALFKYPTGSNGLQTLGYDAKLVEQLPDEVANGYCGVGNPFSLGTIPKGSIVMDIGCGAGVDTLIAATLVGSTGKSVGIDMVPAMLDQAKSNAKLMQLGNVHFMEMSASRLSFEHASIDIVISNGVFNLIIDKQQALANVFNCLKPGGYLMMADQLLTEPLPNDTKKIIASWFR